MTKFEELTQACSDAGARFRKYTFETFAIVQALGVGVQKFLDCASDKLWLYPVISTPEPGKTYNPSGATEFGTDGFWHFGIVLNFGIERLLLHFKLAKQPDGSFVVSPSVDNAPQFNVAGPQGDFDAIFEWVFTSVKNYYETSPFQNKPKQIGFRPLS